MQKNEFLNFIQEFENTKSIKTIKSFIKRDSYNKSIFNLIESEEISSKFIIILNDIFNNLELVPDNVTKELVAIYFKILKSELKFGKIINILSAARIKKIINFIFDSAKLNSLDLAKINLKELFVGNLTKDIEIYIMKRLRSIAGESNRIFYQVINQFDIFCSDHIENLHNIELENVYFLPKICDIAKIKEIFREVSNIVNDLNALDDLITNKLDEANHLMINAAFANITLCSYRNNNFNPKSFESWFNLKKGMLIDSIGKDGTQFLEFLIMNFPKNSGLHISPDQSDSEFKRTLCSVFVVLITISLKTFSKNLLQTYFNEDSNIEDMYLFGAEININPKAWFADILKNPQYLSKAKSIYLCSDECGYMYEIINCTKPWVLGNCPLCNQTIGGKGHKIFERKGHRVINLEEAKVISEKFISEHKHVSDPGFTHYGGNIPPYPIRKMKMRASFILLNSITNALLLYRFGIATSNMQFLNRILKTEDDSVQLINKILRENYNELMNLNENNPDTYYWIFECILMFAITFKDTNKNSMTEKYRDDLEKAFEDSIKNLDFQSSIFEFRSRISKLNDGISIMDFIQEIKTPSIIEYPFLYCFRNTAKITWLHFESSFNKIDNSAYKSSQWFINNFEALHDLQYLYDIQKYCYALTSLYSRKIFRLDAEKITIRDSYGKYPNLKSLYTKFILAWNSVKIKFINLDCKVLKKIEINENTTINTLLIKSGQNSPSNVLFALLSHLISLQNSVKEIIEAEVFRPIDLDRLEKCQVFYIDRDEIIKNFSCNQLLYGRGKEAIFNFEIIEEFIKSSIAASARINTKIKNEIEYQCEHMQKYMNIISELRGKYEQKELDSESQKNLELRLDYFIESNKSPTLISNFYDSFQSLLIILNQYQVQSNEKIKNITLLKETKNKFIPSGEFLEFFRHYHIYNIINVYEIVEEKIFFNILPLVNQIYKIKFENPDEELNELAQFKNYILNTYNQEYFLEFSKVIRRYILRMLTSEFINPENNLNDYIDCESLWRSKFINHIEDILQNFKKAFKISNSVHLEEIYRSLL